ncbi:MAG: hypothetical protein HUK15_04420, partial [Bacteroidales bacterium]|nr:hypothetical protein [Bacteroidales bacterium]
MGTITISVDFLKSLFNIVLCGKPVIDVDVEGVSFEDKQSEEFAEIIAIKLLTGGSVIVWDLNAKAESFEERLNGKAVDFRK